MSTLLNTTLRAIVSPDAAVGRLTQDILDQKTKPRGSLGRLETLACRVAAARGIVIPPLPNKAIVVIGADHGIADEGVSAYPAEVTRQMLLNFARGGAAINVLARHAGARLLVVDMGVRDAVNDPGVIDRRIRAGTASFVHGPAMLASEASAAVEAGIEIAVALEREGVDLIGVGDMGIGNTTASAAIVAALTGIAPAEITGHGTGIDDAAWRHKVTVIERGLATNRPDPTLAMDVLTKVGGLEIAGLCGVVLGAAAARIPVVIDGFIASTAALLAVRLAPAATGYLIASHRSVEVGHRVVLDRLGQLPLLDLDLRLGEGTGAALAMTLVDASLRILHEMSTFAAAGVSETAMPRSPR